MKTARHIDYIIAIVILATFAGFAPRTEASLLSKTVHKVEANVKSVVHDIVDEGARVVAKVKPVLEKGIGFIENFAQPVIDLAKSDKWGEILSFLGALLGGGGTTDGGGAGGSGGGSGGGGNGGGGGEIGTAALRLGYGENQIDTINVNTRIDGVSVLNPGATVRVNVSDVTGTKAGKVAITQVAKGFTADLGEGSLLEVNGVHVAGVQANALSFNQEAQGNNWRLAPNTAVRMNIAEMLGGKYGTVTVDQFLNMPRLEVQGGTTELNQFRSR